LLKGGEFSVFQVYFKEKEENVVELRMVLGEAVVESYGLKGVVRSWLALEFVYDTRK
jgi:hypothetical protein